MIENPTVNEQQRRVLPNPVRVGVLLFATLVVSGSQVRHAHAQFLPVKPDSAAPEQPVAAGRQGDAATSPAELEADATEIPAWERRFFQAATAIDAAIEVAEAETDKARQRSKNPLVLKDALREATAELNDSVRGLKLEVHFRLAGIEAGESHNRRQQEFHLTLESPTFPGHAYDAAVTVVISPEQARELEIGSVVRAEGRLLEKDRRAFDVIYFRRESDSPPLPGDQQKFDSQLDQAIYIGHHYTFPFYVENVRVAEGPLLEEYRHFLTRYARYLEPSDSKARSATDTESLHGATLD